MLETGIPADKLGFKVLNAKRPGEIILSIEQFLDEARADKLSIVDISFVSRGDEILIIFFFRLP